MTSHAREVNASFNAGENSHCHGSGTIAKHRYDAVFATFNWSVVSIYILASIKDIISLPESRSVKETSKGKT